VDSKHAVQFYRDDRFLCQIVTEFAREGLEKGEAVILMATAPHRRELERRLAEHRIDVWGLQQSGQLVLLDARQALDRFMVDGTPDGELFLSNLRPLIASATANWQRTLRVYGEMVDLLWREGNHDAAIRLEEIWNPFAKTTSTRTLCGYAMENFGQEADTAGFTRICAVHTDVQSAEGDDVWPTDRGRVGSS
jgi:hypothetical protein